MLAWLIFVNYIWDGEVCKIRTLSMERQRKLLLSYRRPSTPKSLQRLLTPISKFSLFLSTHAGVGLGKRGEDQGLCELHFDSLNKKQWATYPGAP